MFLDKSFFLDVFGWMFLSFRLSESWPGWVQFEEDGRLGEVWLKLWTASPTSCFLRMVCTFHDKTLQNDICICRGRLILSVHRKHLCASQRACRALIKQSRLILESWMFIFHSQMCKCCWKFPDFMTVGPDLYLLGVVLDRTGLSCNNIVDLKSQF